MFVGNPLRDLARGFRVELENSRHRAIFEISSRTVRKLLGAALKYIKGMRSSIFV